MYAFVVDGEVVSTADRLPNAARVPGSRSWVRLASVPVEVREACGWFAVADARRPADTDSRTHDCTVDVVDGVPSVVWVSRAWTADELAARNEARIRERLASAISATEAPAGTLTDAEIALRVRALSDHVDGLARLALNHLEST